MGKSNTPLRLDDGLVKRATRVGSLEHRTIAGQIEHWADIGERLSRLLSPHEISLVCSGMGRFEVKPVSGTPVDPDAVFDSLGQVKAESAPVGEQLSGFRYQASKSHPGFLEQVDRDGRVRIGQFEQGEFIPVEGDSV